MFLVRSEENKSFPIAFLLLVFAALGRRLRDDKPCIGGAIRNARTTGAVGAPVLGTLGYVWTARSRESEWALHDTVAGTFYGWIYGAVVGFLATVGFRGIRKLF